MAVGYIGLGNMGGNMALRLLECGVDLVVTDVSKEQAQKVLDAGATWADSAAEVASQVDIVLSSLPGPPQVEAVGLGENGILEGIREGAIWADMSTSSPLLVRELDEKFKAKGARVVDAPVSGGPPHCRKGELAIFLGATEEQKDRLEPVLKHLAPNILHIGEVGAGSVAKIVNNSASMVTWNVLGEVFSLGVKAGLDHQTIHEVLMKGAFGRGLLLSDMVPQVAFKHNYEPAGFALNLGRKDVALATQLGRDLNIPLPMMNYSEQNAVELVQHGHGNKDTAVLFSLQEARAGVKMHDDDAKEFNV